MSKRLLPLVPADLVVDQVLPAPDCLTILCRSCITAPLCPGCGQPSSRRHSSYPRRLVDLPWQGRRVQIEVQVRRLRCGRPGCEHRIFAERLPAAAGPHAQRTVRLGGLQRHIGLTLGGKAGARLTDPERQHGSADVPATQPHARLAAYPARRVARMLTADMVPLAVPDRAYVERLLALSPALATVRALAQRFGALVRTHAADALTPWLTDAEQGKLRGFAAGLRQDEQAVRAALRLPWSSGQVEGQVTRLKLVKRQGYGRAKLDLLKAHLIDVA